MQGSALPPQAWLRVWQEEPLAVFSEALQLLLRRRHFVTTAGRLLASKAQVMRKRFSLRPLEGLVAWVAAQLLVALVVLVELAEAMHPASLRDWSLQLQSLADPGALADRFSCPSRASIEIDSSLVSAARVLLQHRLQQHRHCNYQIPNLVQP
mmetsp:Transcript_85832/g.151981  ORF Transcript_85832/g.151981 Transcript_85832/m.151981 type:complete len:153 (+) Transcript_85832:468-926(+)